MQEDKITIDGCVLYSASYAGKTVGLSRDYVARLCRRGAVAGRRVGAGWYIDLSSLNAFLQAQAHAQTYRHRSLSRERQHEYSTKSNEIRKTPSVVFGAGDLMLRERRFVYGLHARRLHERMRQAFEKKDARDAVGALANNLPTSLPHVSLHDAPLQVIAHAPSYLASPAMELLHKIVALTMALVVVFGAYAVFSPSYATYAYGSLRSVARAASRTVQDSLNGTLEAQANVAAAAAAGMLSHPSLAVSLARRVVDSVASRLSAPVASKGQVSVRILSSAPVQAVAQARADTSPTSASAQAAAAASALQSVPPVPVTSGAPAVSAGSAASLPSIATAVPFTGPTVAYGDLISHDQGKNIYTLTSGSGAQHVYGVVVERPTLLFEPSAGESVPVVTSGAALVNVTLENGSIAPGDALAPSSIPGKARKANPGESIIGVALQPFNGAGGVYLRTPSGGEVLSGTISVDVGATGPASAATGAPACASAVCRLWGGINPDLIAVAGRYVLAALIASLSLVLAFRSFMSEANYGVISIGRNPRAKMSIQSLVVFNAILAMAIASAGLFAAMVVLFAT